MSAPDNAAALPAAWYTAEMACTGVEHAQFDSASAEHARERAAGHHRWQEGLPLGRGLSRDSAVHQPPKQPGGPRPVRGCSPAECSSVPRLPLEHAGSPSENRTTEPWPAAELSAPLSTRNVPLTVMLALAGA